MSFKAPSCLKRQLGIRLNVYDLVEANKYGAGAIGAFHSGCVIDGIEYSYGLNDYDPPRTGNTRILTNSYTTMQAYGVASLSVHQDSCTGTR